MIEILKTVLQKRKPDAHKGNFGKALLICGSTLMPGAAILSTRAALRCGVGLATLATERSVIECCASAVPEAVFFDTSADRRELISEIGKADAILIGCGLTQTEKAYSLFDTVLQYGKCPLIIDADGINMLARGIQLSKYAGKVVLTPHAGEMGRLLGISAEAVQADRATAARECYRRYGTITVLKGKNTIVQLCENENYVNNSGNAGMAKPGCGDMLSGMIVSFAAQGIDLEKAVIGSVYLHGAAGDICAKQYTQRSMQVSDMIETLPSVFMNFE